MTAEELGQMIWNVKELLRNVYDNKDVEVQRPLWQLT